MLWKGLSDFSLRHHVTCHSHAATHFAPACVVDNGWWCILVHLFSLKLGYSTVCFLLGILRFLHLWKWLFLCLCLCQWSPGCLLWPMALFFYILRIHLAFRFLCISLCDSLLSSWLCGESYLAGLWGQTTRCCFKLTGPWTFSSWPWYWEFVPLMNGCSWAKMPLVNLRAMLNHKELAVYRPASGSGPHPLKSIRPAMADCGRGQCNYPPMVACEDDFVVLVL